MCLKADTCLWQIEPICENFPWSHGSQRWSIVATCTVAFHAVLEEGQSCPHLLPEQSFFFLVSVVSPLPDTNTTLLTNRAWDIEILCYQNCT